MKITTTAGLVGFLLALSGINLPKADSAVPPASTDSTQSTIESRLTRLSESIKQQEDQTFASTRGQDDPIYLAGGFLNRAPSFRNYGRGWVNRVTGWGNGGGGFANRNGGGGFVNRHGGGSFFNR